MPTSFSIESIAEFLDEITGIRSGKMFQALYFSFFVAFPSFELDCQETLETDLYAEKDAFNVLD